MRNKILLDTTYILPLLGIRVKQLKGFDVYIERVLDEYEVYYHPVSLIEAKWELIHLKKEIGRDNWIDFALRYRQGLNYIYKSGRLHQLEFTNINVEDEVDNLIVHGYRDYFDLLIFSTAFIENIALLTEDEELINIPRKLSRYMDMKVMNWENLVNLIRKSS